MRTFFRSLVCLALALVLWPADAVAFDTAHHFEMTWNALKREGFSDDAIRIVMLQNWLTDFYGGQEVVLQEAGVLDQTADDMLLMPGLKNTDSIVGLYETSALVRMLVRSGDRPTVENAALLHFDNL